MKRFLAFIYILLFSSPLMASELRVNGETQSFLKPASYSMEPSLSLSSINNGSRFMSIAMVARVASWLSLGVEGDLPADFEKQEQFYMGRLLGRILLLKSVNTLYLQGSGSIGFFNGVRNTDNFAALGAAFGYMRALSNDWEIGGRLGVQYVNARFEEGSVSEGGDTFNNRLSVVGSYRF